MKRKIISIILAFAMLCALVPCIAMAEDVASGVCGTDATWTLDDSGTLTISGNGEIPNNARYEWKDYKKDIKRVVVEEGITKISGFYFDYCTSLTTVELPDSLTSIELLFNGCTALTAVNVSEGNTEYCSENGVLFDKNKQTILQYPLGKTDLSYTIPDSVNKIKTNAFDEAVYLVTVQIPASVAEISSAFDWCGALAEINVDEANGNYCSVDGILFDKDKTKIIKYPAGKNQTSYTIPDTVTEIGGAAFLDSGLETIVIPDTVNKIGNSAFSSCASLVNVDLPEGLESIGFSAFRNCSSLTGVTVPKGITALNSSLFEGCTSLENVILPKSIIVIGWAAFYGCTSLESISLPENVTEIGDEAFYECTALKEIKISSSVNSIGWDAFYGCSALESITIPYGVEKIKTETFYDCTSLKSVSIPSSVSVIDQYAFCGCSALESISLPEGVREIECNAFENCETLKSIYIPNSIKYIYECAFYNCYDLTDVYYNGTEKEWETLRMYNYIDDVGNMMLRYADIHYDAKPIINGTPAITAEGNTYTATVPLKNVAVDCQLISVLYNDGIMKAIESKSIPLNAESESISVSADETDQIKLFIWDSLSGAVPMCGGYSETIVKE